MKESIDLYINNGRVEFEITKDYDNVYHIVLDDVTIMELDPDEFKRLSAFFQFCETVLDKRR
jgi:hypothetical protein